MTNKELNVLRLENESRFSKKLSQLAVNDTISYGKIINAILTYNNLKSTEKSNFGKQTLDITNDLKDAIIDYVRGGEV